MSKQSQVQLQLEQLDFTGFTVKTETVETVPEVKALAPMLKQYVEIKEKYPEHALLFQVGDFYEVFFEDARIVSDALGIRLTSRDKDQENPVPMCGVPIHALDNYLPRLLQQGFSCVLVSQVEDARGKKGMVKREITRIVTPGVRYEGDGLDEKRFNYLSAVCFNGTGGGALCCVDVSTGSLRVQEGESLEELIEGLRRVKPAELLLPVLGSETAAGSQKLMTALLALGRELGFKTVNRPFPQITRGKLEERLAPLLPEASVRQSLFEKFGQLSPWACSAMAATLSYVEEVSFSGAPALSDVSIEETGGRVVIDAATRRNLELTEARIDGERKNSLLYHIDYSRTAMGCRLLSEWITAPSTSLEEIRRRHDAVEELVGMPAKREELRRLFSGVRDLDRLISRVTGFRATPRDLGSIRESIEVFPAVAEALSSATSELLTDVASQFDPLGDISERLKAALCDEPPLRVNEGGIFREGFHAEVDRLKHIRSEGHTWLSELETKERKRSGISGLKIRYNSVFGYYIEVSKANLAKVPSDYERRQTLANAERFVTSELKEFEANILSAKSRQIELERELFTDLRNWLHQHTGRIQRVSRLLGTLDVCCSLAHLAEKHDYRRPVMRDDMELIVRKGRHPVVERVVGAHQFIPNDTYLNGGERRFAVLTGPNMGGKSTYLRQIGLIQILAQAGSFVPAEKAELGLVDRIFTRIGAADDLSRGDSTFMVEMREASAIVRKASERSLVLIDEIGRGTATTDGLALATAISEWLLEVTRCRAVFATHFHELTRLPEVKSSAFCLAVGVIEKEREIVFTHRIEEKAADRSYGIEVARLAGLPETLLQRAEELLASMEAGESALAGTSLHAALEISSGGAGGRFAGVLGQKQNNETFTAIADKIRSYAPNSMTPLQALQELVELKALLKD